jgi:hypothetical protein
MEFRNESGDHDNFTMIPNFIFRLGMSPYAIALYGYIKQAAGETGRCFKSTATITKELNMSAGTVSAAKKVLEQNALIRIDNISRAQGGKPYHSIAILDVWERNAKFINEHKKGRSPVEQATSPDEIASSPSEIIKNPDTKNPDHSETSKTEVSEGSPLIREAIASVNLDKGDRVTNYVKSPNPLPASIRNSIEHPKVPKTIEPTTPLSRYLMEQSKYGNYQWKGFASAGERDDWYRMEDTHDERDIREAIDWACHQKRFGKKKLVHNIIMAVDNNKPARNTQQLIGRVANDEENE